MAKAVIPSEDTISQSQIGKIMEDVGAGLRKSGLQRASMQIVIETQIAGLTADIVALIRTRVEAVSTMIVRRVTVPARSFQAGLDATERRQYTARDVVDGVAACLTGVEQEVFFVKPPADYYTKGVISCRQVAEFLDSMGLKPSPHAAAAANEADPSLADTHPNATQWQDANGKYCYAAFCRWDVERDVDVYRFDDVWSDNWWFAGVRTSLHFTASH